MLRPFYNKNEEYVKAAVNSELLQKFNLVFIKTASRQQVAQSSDFDAESGLNKETAASEKLTQSEDELTVKKKKPKKIKPFDYTSKFFNHF